MKDLVKPHWFFKPSEKILALSSSSDLCSHADKKAKS